jgi:hypothetical protein
MKRLGWESRCLIAGVAIFAVTLGMPWWRWAIRGQLDVLKGSVRIPQPRTSRQAGPSGEGPALKDLLAWLAKERNYGKAPLISQPNGVEEELANALWIPDGYSCRKALRTIADANPRSALAQAMVATDVGPVRRRSGSSPREYVNAAREQPDTVRIATARRGAALEPDNAFWALAQLSNRGSLTKGEMREALIPACKAKRYANPRVAYARRLSESIVEGLGRGSLAATRVGAIPRWRTLMVGREIANLGDTPSSLRARLGLLRADSLRAKAGWAVEVLVATFEADGAIGVKYIDPLGNGQMGTEARVFQRKLANAGIDLEGFDLFGEMQNLENLRLAVRASTKSPQPSPLPLIDYDLPGAAALIAALLAFPCAMFVAFVRGIRARVTPGPALPARAGGIVSIVAVAVLSVIAGCSFVLWSIDFPVPGAWVAAALVVVLACLPPGRQQAHRLVAPTVLLCALLHVGLLVANVRQDGFCARVIDRELHQMETPFAATLGVDKR